MPSICAVPCISTCPLKKIYGILKIQISKKITVQRNFFLSQPEPEHWRVDGRVDDEKKIHDGWEPMVEHWRYDGEGT